MKKKWLIGLTALCMSVATLGFTACGEPEKGDKGDTGADGKSAYQIWLDNGHTGTEEDFLNWLKGEDGAPGSPGATGQTGATGATGADGKSAYEIWLDNGNTGTEEDFLNWLKGEDGAPGSPGATGQTGATGATGADGKSAYQIWLDNGNTGTEEDFLNWLKGLNDHDFGDWICFTANDVPCEQRLFYRICNDCSIIEWKNGTAEDHDWQEDYLYDNSFHWIKCEDCTTTKDSGEHSVDERGYCTICDNLVGATEGILYGVSADGTYAEVIGYEGTERKIIIADIYESLPVKNIYVDAFRSKSIMSVVIPDSVESIGYAAFAHCDSLTEVAIGDSVETIGDWAFSDCTSLTEIVIPDNVTSIGRDAFSSCTSLASVTIGDSVTSIGLSAFNNCTSLASVTIGDSVTSIGERAFSGCDSLTFNAYDNCKYLGRGSNPYYALIETTATNYSSYQIHEDTKIIADKAFYECSRLSSITIPDNVTSIGWNAFYNCTSLTKVNYTGTIDNWAQIGFDGFSLDNGYDLYINDVLVTEANITTATKISVLAFCNCNSLTSVTLGDSVTSIGNSAFSSCDSLTSIVIGDSVESIGEQAFYNCTSLTEVYYKGTASEWGEISVGSNNTSLTDATRYYYVENEADVPTDGGNYWHYVAGVPTKWVIE